ncbi:hypothetical protein LDENG_00189180 [Lucifuga dentata]|nr:hypothetical protein LDENG_00189180 [Lucifuga dentata]
MFALQPLWDRLFFWQKVPDRVPLEPQRFRLLNPQVIRETAMDLLKYPPPRPRIWSWDQNVPTLGVSALTLASLLCDEVSLAGFGYDLSQQGAPLHYFDQQPMSTMLQQKMHNVDRETKLLQSLVSGPKLGLLLDKVRLPRELERSMISELLLQTDVKQLHRKSTFSTQFQSAHSTSHVVTIIIIIIIIIYI